MFRWLVFVTWYLWQSKYILKSSALWDSSHRLLNGAIVFADVVNDPRDAEGAGEAQQVGHEAERDAEDEGPAERFP